MLKRYVWIFAIAVAALGTGVMGCGDDDEGGDNVFDTSGVWTGTFVANDAAVSGDILIDVTQANNGDGTATITGTASMTNVPCFSNVLFRGTVNTETLSYQAEFYSEQDPENLISINGTFFPEANSMEGSYFNDNWGVCTGGFGDFQATRTGG